MNWQLDHAIIVWTRVKAITMTFFSASDKNSNWPFYIATINIKKNLILEFIKAFSIRVILIWGHIWFPKYLYWVSERSIASVLSLFKLSLFSRIFLNKLFGSYVFKNFPNLSYFSSRNFNTSFFYMDWTWSENRAHKSSCNFWMTHP